MYTGSKIWLDLTSNELVLHNTDPSYISEEVYFVVPSNDPKTTEYSKHWEVKFYFADCSVTELLLKDPSEFAGISWQFGSAVWLRHEVSLF